MGLYVLSLLFFKYKYVMLKLFKYEGYKVIISEEAFTLKVFNTIWKRDKSKHKETAMMELGYIYHFCDPRSDYQYITDDTQRDLAIREGEGIPKKWKVDKELKEAMEYYNSFKPTAALLLEDTRIAVDKLREMLREIDLKELDDHGKPVYTLNTITATIKQIPQLVKDLDEAEKALNTEMKQGGRMRGGNEKTIMEDSLDI